MWDQLVVEEGVLLCLLVSPTCTDSTAKELVVPKYLHQSILENIHAGATGGHLGQAKTFSKLGCVCIGQAIIGMSENGVKRVLVQHVKLPLHTREEI